MSDDTLKVVRRRRPTRVTFDSHRPVAANDRTMGRDVKGTFHHNRHGEEAFDRNGSRDENDIRLLKLECLG
jgi:hypothetical protein